MGKRTFTSLVFMMLSGFWPTPPAGADVHDYGDPAADLRTAYERAIGGAVPAGPSAEDGQAIAPPQGKMPVTAGAFLQERHRDLTRAVQESLRAAGHDPGPADGLMGPETRDAIRDFQRQHGLEADGEITGGLIDALADALASTPRVAPALPANAHRIPFLNDWACDGGFRRSGHRCERVYVPDNATLGILGDSWTCNPGFRRVAGGCEKLVVPLNAKPRPAPDIPREGWDCNRGYRRVGQQCERLPIPRNAARDRFGNGWTCNSGYRQAGNSCIRKTLPERSRTCCGIPSRP